MSSSWTSSEGMTHKQIVERIGNDPEIQASLEAELLADPVQAERRRLYQEAAGELLDELTELVPDFTNLGRPIRTVGDLSQRAVFTYDAEGNETSRRGIDYRAAVPTLLEWLPKVRYPPVADGIVSVLSKPFAKKLARPVFLALFRDPPPLYDPQRPETSESRREGLRLLIGEGLGLFADSSVADELIELAQDPSYGRARLSIVCPGLVKTKDPRVPDVLMALLDDPMVATSAIQGLGRLRYAPARTRLEEAVHSTNEGERYYAKRALKRLV